MKILSNHIPAKNNERFFETERDNEIVLMNGDTSSFHELNGVSR